MFLHLITDGRDVSPNSGLGFVEEIEKICDDKIKIASISGRFYAMDRDNRWERVEKAYRVMVDGALKTDLEAKAYMQSMYGKSITDEFIEPDCV